MEKKSAYQLALSLMNEHLGDNHGVRFKWDNAKRRLGAYNYSENYITLSLPLVLLNEEAQVKDTILHEIAHVIAGPGAKHGYRWKVQCLKVGAIPKTCADGRGIVQPPAKYQAPCPSCGHIINRHRLPSGETSVKLACGFCCRKYNGGRFSDKYSVVLGVPSVNNYRIGR